MTARSAGTALSVLTLDLQGEMFALDAVAVREILDVVPVTEVPGVELFLGGLINVRGRVVPLADIRLKLGMEPHPPTIDTRIIVIETEIDGEPTVFGIRADKVHEVADLPAPMLEDVPSIGLRWPTKYIRAIGKRGTDFIMILNLAGLFSTANADAEPHPAPSGASTPH